MKIKEIINLNPGEIIWLKNRPEPCYVNRINIEINGIDILVHIYTEEGVLLIGEPEDFFDVDPKLPVRRPTNEDYILAARDQYEEEGSLEIDDDADVSRNSDEEEDGAYIQAWVWVEKDQALDYQQ